MKSNNAPTKVNFEEISERLRAFIKLRINSGEFTERSLARVFAISQPHLHNMLKGVRKLNVEFSDQILNRFKISILDLISDSEIFDYLDEKNADWLTRAAERKPPARSRVRENDSRAPWREKQGS